MKFNFFASFLTLFVISMAPVVSVAEEFVDCGPGWIVVDNGTIEGVPSQICEKLWCVDLENGKTMGSGDAAYSGYIATTNPVTIEASGGETIECFGQRKWCSGETAGTWNAEYGAYTKQGEDSIQYVSSQRGDCYSWNAGSPKSAGCADGQIPILVNGKWGCSGKSATSSQTPGISVNFGQKSTTQGAFHRAATLKKK